MVKKGELIFDNLIPWIIALVVLIGLAFLYFKFGEKGNSAIDFFRNLWRFGG